jgi:hypothetical protein
MGLGNTTFGAACGFTCIAYRMRAAKDEGGFALKFWLFVQEKIRGGKAGFCWGFCGFLVVCGGKNVVSLW